MTKKISTYFISIVLLLSGCSAQTIHNIQLHGEGSLIDVSYGIIDTLVMTSTSPLSPADPQQPILVTTPVDNNNFSKTSNLGRALQDQFISRLVQQHFSVKEVNLQSTLDIQPQHGETILSRDPMQLAKETDAQAILVSTISQAGQIIYINARLINPATGVIISSTDEKLVMNNHIQSLMQKNQTNYISEPQPPKLNSILY